MNGRLFKLYLKPEVFELDVWDMRHTGMPNKGWPGFVEVDLTLWGFIFSFSFGLNLNVTPRWKRLDDIRDNLTSIAAYEQRQRDQQQVE